jgi:Na+(H+)/acetate symporter ActP
LSSDAEITENDRLKSAHDEEIALTRSIGIVTTQSAILVASLSETATRFLRQFSETTEKSAEAARTSLRTVLVTVLIMGILAAIAAAAAIVSYFEERENRQTTNQWHESVLRSMKETAAAQEAQIKSLDDKVRELSDRQNELAAPLPAPATDGAAQKAASEAEAPIQPSPKPASPKRASKRKTSR